MFAQEAVEFLVGIGWAVQLLSLPPWRAVYELWSHFGTFSYGERVLQWFGYVIASAAFGIAYLVGGGLLLGVAYGIISAATHNNSASVDTPARRSSILMLPAFLAIAVGGLGLLVGGAAFVSSLVPATVAFIYGTLRFISGNPVGP